MIINKDLGREKEISEAKLKPFDGKTIYSTHEDEFKTEYFMGYQLKPFRIKKRNGTIEIGTTICSQYFSEPKPRLEVENIQTITHIIHVDDSWIEREHKEREQLWEAEIWEGRTQRAQNFRRPKIRI